MLERKIRYKRWAVQGLSLEKGATVLQTLAHDDDNDNNNNVSGIGMYAVHYYLVKMTDDRIGPRVYLIRFVFSRLIDEVTFKLQHVLGNFLSGSDTECGADTMLLICLAHSKGCFWQSHIYPFKGLSLIDSDRVVYEPLIPFSVRFYRTSQMRRHFVAITLHGYNNNTRCKSI